MPDECSLFGGFLGHRQNDSDHPAPMGDLTTLKPHTNRRSVCIALLCENTLGATHDPCFSSGRGRT